MVADNPNLTIPKGVPESANDKQVGGDHYKRLSIQHWDYVLGNNIPYLEAQALRYVSRWRLKNGIEDLQKAMHYLEKLIEHQATQPQWGWLRRLFSAPMVTISAMEYGVSNEMSEVEINFHLWMERWHIKRDLSAVRSALATLRHISSELNTKNVYK